MTIYSKRFGGELYLGKRPARHPSSDHVLMSDLLKALPAGALPPIPEHFGTGYDFGGTGWKMLGNGPCDDGSVPRGWYCFNGAGNCDWASWGHVLMQAAFNAKRPIPTFTCMNILNQYAEYLGLSGAEALTANNDQGTDMQEGITWGQTKGIADSNGVIYKAGQSVALDAGNIEQLWAGTYLFEDVKIGVNLTQANVTQFDGSKNPIWDWDATSQVVGGHSIPTMGVRILPMPTWRSTCPLWSSRRRRLYYGLQSYIPLLGKGCRKPQ